MDALYDAGTDVGDTRIMRAFRAATSRTRTVVIDIDASLPTLVPDQR